MTISLSALLYCMVIAYILIYYRDTHKIFVWFVFIMCFLEICNFQGYFFMSGEKEYGILGIHKFGLLLYTVVYLLIAKVRVKRDTLRYFVLYLFLPILTMCVQFLFPYEGLVMPGWLIGEDLMATNWDVYVAGGCSLMKLELPILSIWSGYRILVTYAVIVLGIKALVDKNDLMWICKRLVGVSMWITVYGYIEFVMKNVLGLGAYTFDFTRYVFGVGSSTCTALDHVIMSNGLYRIQGFTREPSHLVISLFFFSILILIYKKICVIYENTAKYDNKYSWLLCANMVLMPMTGGMSCIWMLSVLLGAYVILNYFPEKINLNRFFTFVICSFIAAGFVFGFVWFLVENFDIPMLNRLVNTFDTIVALADGKGYNGLTIDGSALARFTSILICFGNWLDRPLFGLGLMSTGCHDFTVGMLVTHGLLGCYAWYKMITAKFDGLSKYNHIFLIFVIFVNGLPFGLGNMVFYVILAELTTLYRWKGTYGV